MDKHVNFLMIHPWMGLKKEENNINPCPAEPRYALPLQTV